MRRSIETFAFHRFRPAAVAIFSAALLLCTGSASAESGSAPADGWQFAVSPYLWVPTINARINFPYNGGGGSGGSGGGSGGSGGSSSPGVIEAQVGPNQYLTHLDFALMVNGEVRRGPWSVLGDLIYISASGIGSSVNRVQSGGLGQTGQTISSQLNTGTDSAIKSTLATLVGGYEFVHSDVFRLDAFAGLRTVNLDATLDWSLSASVTLPSGVRELNRTGSVSASKSLVDGLVGVRGRYQLSEHWSLPYTSTAVRARVSWTGRALAASATRLAGAAST